MGGLAGEGALMGDKRDVLLVECMFVSARRGKADNLLVCRDTVCFSSF